MQPSAGLLQRLVIATADRVSTPAELVQEAARVLHGWLGEQGSTLGVEQLGRQLEADLAPWIEAHGHRGACGRFVDRLRRTYHYGLAKDPARLTELLQEELGLWTWTTPQLVGGEAWNGEPLAPGMRVCVALDQAQHAAALLGVEHTVCIFGAAPGIAEALELAREEGKRPRVVLAEGGPDGAGRRLAAQLAEAGVAVTFCFDHALADHVHEADRIWLGTEAIGASAFLARVGTRRLLEEARSNGAPVEVFATADDLFPGGELHLPSWCQHESWLLWEYAPQGIRLETQLYEKVSFECIDAFLTEVGVERPTSIHLRALRMTPSQPCDAIPNETAERR